MDNNAAAILAATLVGLQNVVVAPREGRITTLLMFSRRVDEDVREFIWQLEIVFLVNQVADNKKFYIEVSCLTDIAANWYELNKVTLANWNTAGQPNNMQFRTSIIKRFNTAA